MEPSVMATTDASEEAGGLSVRAPVEAIDTSPRARDVLAALAQFAATLVPPPAPVDPLAVARGLAEASALGAWLSTPELAQLLGMAPGTVRGWSTGHRPRPGYTLERRKEGTALWWRVRAEVKAKKRKPERPA
jgi:hypothetical protein